MAPTPNCILVRPPSDSSHIERLGAACSRRADASGYRVAQFRVRELSVLGGSGRSMNVLSSPNASRLYRMLHRAPSLVVGLTSALISTDPKRDPPNKRAALMLDEFVGYKALYRIVRGDADIPALFEAFERWLNGSNCDGPGDPRALPFHVFDAGDGAQELDSATGARRFQKKFGGSNRRLDRSDRVWTRGVEHGKQAAEVAGCQLPAGMHWDVAVSRGSTRVANVVEVWRVKGGGYVNVYPDEHIRGPQRVRKGLVRRVWSAG